MKLKFKHQKKASVIAVVLVLSMAGAAYAYWTSTGSGTGSGATGTSAELVANQTSTVTAMGPGVAAQTLSGNFDNSNDGPVFVASVTAAITGVSGGDGVCTAADYTLSSPTMTVGAEVPAGLAVGTWSGATIEFNNNPLANQDGCKNATVAISYTIV